MRGFASVCGWMAVALSVPLILLGLLAWLPGGMMFALPYMFLVPGILLATVRGLFVRAGRRSG